MVKDDMKRGIIIIYVIYTKFPVVMSTSLVSFTFCLFVFMFNCIKAKSRLIS